MLVFTLTSLAPQLSNLEISNSYYVKATRAYCIHSQHFSNMQTLCNLCDLTGICSQSGIYAVIAPYWLSSTFFFYFMLSSQYLEVFELDTRISELCPMKTLCHSPLFLKQKLQTSKITAFTLSQSKIRFCFLGMYHSTELQPSFGFMLMLLLCS